MPVSRRLFLSVVCCLSAVLGFVATCQAQSGFGPYEGANAKLVDFKKLPAASQRCFAVVGDVEQPGVYLTTDRKVSRARVLKAAGSLGKMGGYYTFYNSGLSNQSSAIFDAETTEAAHRDVIVVAGSKKPGSAVSSSDFHVAIIGLKTDPVVVRLPASQRSLAALLTTRLKQHPEVATTATVNGVKSTEPLKNGDVILVNSHLVDRSGLDECDAILLPYQLDPPAAPAKSTSSELPAVEPQFASLPALVAPSINSLEPPMTVEVAEGIGRPVLAAAEASVPPTSLEAPTALLHQTVTPVSVPVVAHETPTLRQTAHHASSQKVAEAAPGTSIRSLVILIALATLGLGIALLWIASERRLRTAAPPEPVQIGPTLPEVPLIDCSDLIRGDVDVEDEPVVLPARIALHGEAVGQKRLIVHPPEPLAGPHFGNVGATEKSATSRAVRAPVAVESPNTPVRSARDAEGLLDRVLVAMQREGRK